MYLSELHAWQIGLLLLPVVFNFWAIWHIFRHVFPTPTEKIWWMLGAIVLPVVGGLTYVIFGMRRATALPKH